MGSKNRARDRRLSWIMTNFNTPWKVVLVFDIVMVIISLLVMSSLGPINFTYIFIILITSTLFSYVISSILKVYYEMNNSYLLELHRVNEELATINANLQAVSYTVAHDLKTPITSIVHSTYLLKEKTKGLPGPQAEMAEQIELSANKMMQIIDELLLLANIGTDKVDLIPFSMKEVVSSCITRLDPMITATSTEIVLPESWPPVLGHKPWIEEVWVNYISNAIKYGGKPPKLILGSDTNNGKVIFWVNDNGPGIATEDQTILFKEFSRLHGDEAEGHGLGLAIVRRIVENLNGEVGVESQPGKGSTFYFTLPSNSS